MDSFVDSKLAPGKQELFNGFSYVSTSSFEQAVKQRRKIMQQNLSGNKADLFVAT